MWDVARRIIARQLGGPSGPVGSYVARMLDKHNGPAIRAAADRLALQGGETVADIGFGGGAGLEALLEKVGPDGRVIGIDTSSSMVRRARRARGDAGGRLWLDEGSLAALPLPDGLLDGWLTINTIYFVADLRTAAGELARVLGPGGRGVLGMGDPDAMAQDPITQHGFRLRPVDEVVEVLADAGLVAAPDRLEHGGRPPYHLLVCRHR